MFSFLDKYFGEKSSLHFILLFSHRSIRFLGINLISLFYSIYLYERLGFSLENVLLFFIASYFLFFVLIPMGAKIMTKVGLTYSMVFSTPFFFLFFIFSYFFELTRSFSFLILLLVTYSLGRSLYWSPYHTEMASLGENRSLKPKHRFFWGVTLALSVVAPILGSWLIEKWGFDFVFIIGAFLSIFSVIPILFIPNIIKKYQYGYLDSFKKIFSPEYRYYSLMNLLSGALSVIETVIWPIFIWFILGERYLTVGIIASLAIIATGLLNVIVGNWIDKIDGKRLIKISSVMDCIGWFAKSVVVTPFQIFLVSTYHSFSRVLLVQPIDKMAYSLASKNGSHVDEYTVMREMAINLGKILMLVVVLGLLSLWELSTVFLFSAFLSLILGYFIDKVR